MVASVACCSPGCITHLTAPLNVLYIARTMTPRDRIVAFRPDEDIEEAMTALWERDGISYSEQIRRALREWLQDRGVLEPLPKTKTARTRVSPRKRA